MSEEETTQVLRYSNPETGRCRFEEPGTPGAWIELAYPEDEWKALMAGADPVDDPWKVICPGCGELHSPRFWGVSQDLCQGCQWREEQEELIDECPECGGTNTGPDIADYDWACEDCGAYYDARTAEPVDL